MGRAIFFAACVVVGVMFLFERQSRAAADTRFGNMTYRTNSSYIAETVTLANGYGVVRRLPLHTELYYDGHYMYGDFNHDGLRDAAVTIGESQGGSDDEVSLAFLINDGTTLVHRQSAYLGDSAIIRSLRVRDGTVVVDMLIHQEGDCQAGPTKHVKMAYVYGGPERWIEGAPL